MDVHVPADIDVDAEIERLRRQRKAVILAHFYQDPDIQDIADFIGDSLQLARQARDTDAEVILFCGVHFMAETAAILNPDRVVLIPDPDAGCSLADSCPADQLRAWRDRHPDHAVISYINCSAEVKALSDVICTSSNAEKVLRSFPEDQPILFAPDRNLGSWLKRRTGRDLVLWQGTCIVHETFSERKLVELRTRHPGALVLAHPECEPAILRHADHVGSTASILRFSRENPATEFIVATEPGILHQMGMASPGKSFYAVPGQDEGCNCNECPFMRLHTMEKIYLALRDLRPRVQVSPEVRRAALRPLHRMLELG